MSPEITTSQQVAPLTTVGRIFQQLHSGTPISALDVDEIDECIVELEGAERLYKAAKETYDEVKETLIALAQTHGTVPAGAGQSKRLLGRRNVITITTATSTTISESAVEELLAYLVNEKKQWLFGQLFASETKHKLIDGARNVLASFDLPKRTHEKVLSLFGRCFDIKPKSPSLKYDLIVPVKLPKKPRAGKVAA